MEEKEHFVVGRSGNRRLRPGVEEVVNLIAQDPLSRGILAGRRGKGRRVMRTAEGAEEQIFRLSRYMKDEGDDETA